LDLATVTPPGPLAQKMAVPEILDRVFHGLTVEGKCWALNADPKSNCTIAGNCTTHRLNISIRIRSTGRSGRRVGVFGCLGGGIVGIDEHV
jgi:hypothetical protein